MVIIYSFTLQPGPFSPPGSGSEDVPEHIKRSQIPRWSILDQLYKEREEMPVASFLGAWENSNWADYRVFKEKGGAPGISLQGNHYPGRHRSDPQRVMLGKSGPERTSELSLERQRILQGESWLEGVPDSREWKTTPVAPVLLKHEI